MLRLRSQTCYEVFLGLNYRLLFDNLNEFNSLSNSYVYLYFGDYRIKSVEVSETGIFVTDFYVPSYAVPGTAYGVTIQDEDGTKLAEKQFTVGARIKLGSSEGEVDKWIEIDGCYFDADKEVHLYFSSDKANIGDNIGAAARRQPIRPC